MNDVRELMLVRMRLAIQTIGVGCFLFTCASLGHWAGTEAFMHTHQPGVYLSFDRAVDCLRTSELPEQRGDADPEERSIRTR